MTRSACLPLVLALLLPLATVPATADESPAGVVYESVVRVALAADGTWTATGPAGCDAAATPGGVRVTCPPPADAADATLVCTTDLVAGWTGPAAGLLLGTAWCDAEAGRCATVAWPLTCDASVTAVATSGTCDLERTTLAAAPGVQALGSCIVTFVST